MSKELEIEFKNMLTKEEYQQLVKKYFPDSSPFSQTNCYFDTPNSLLKEKHMGLRLRKRDGKNECTLKVPTNNQHAYQEITDKLSDEKINQLIAEQTIYQDGEVAKYLLAHDFPINDLQMIGSLTTHRLEKNITEECLLVLDESHFGEVIDFELEMEVGNIKTGELFFNEFLINEHIKRRLASKKIARMLEYSN